MTPSQDSFEDVADWCERYLEAQHGLEVGMTFGALLRAYGRLAAMPARPDDASRRYRDQQAKAEELLLAFSVRHIIGSCFLTAYNQTRPVDSEFVRTNMIYDTGPHPGAG